MARPPAGQRGWLRSCPRWARRAITWASWAGPTRKRGAGAPADSMGVLVAADDQSARRLEADIRFFWGGAHDPAAVLDEIAGLPGIDVSPYADLSPDRSCIVERDATLYRLSEAEPAA